MGVVASEFVEVASEWVGFSAVSSKWVDFFIASLE